MANSTLSPGKPSAAIVKLRNAAMAELDAPQLNIVNVSEPSFDAVHDEEPASGRTEFPRFRPISNPHVGNGRGPIG
jgi:hypothetical protein